MTGLSSLLKLLTSLISLYNLLCFVRIIITWIPQAGESKFASALAAICDPYLNIFRKIKWTQIGVLDLSPAIALCVLGALSIFLGQFANAGAIRIGLILGSLVEIAGSILDSIISLFLLLLVIRLIMILLSDSQNSASPIFQQLDYSLRPLIDRMSAPFIKGMPAYKTKLIICIVELVILLLFCGFIIRLLSYLLMRLPV